MIRVHAPDAIRAMEIPEREDVVAGLIPRGDAILLSAREKAGKGLLMWDACASIATGETFLGRAVLQGPTIYLALEEGRRTIRDRLRARIGDRVDVPFYVAFLDGSDDQTFRLDDRDSIVGLRDLTVARRPVLIVLDVLREAHDGRENESDDMAILLRPIRQIAHEFNVAIVVTHHASKAGGFRGSTSIAAAFDDTIEFIREDLSDDVQIRGLLTARGRDLPKVSQRIEFDPEAFRWREIEGPPVVSQPGSVREKIFGVLNSTDAWLTAEDIAARIDGVKVKTVQNALTNLMAERYRQVLVKGTGTRNDPRRYHGIHRRIDANAPESGSLPGANGDVTSIGSESPGLDDSHLNPRAIPVDLTRCQRCRGDLPDDRDALCPGCGDIDDDMAIVQIAEARP